MSPAARTESEARAQAEHMGRREEQRATPSTPVLLLARCLGALLRLGEQTTRRADRVTHESPHDAHDLPPH